jgi:hypothetical protein
LEILFNAASLDSAEVETMPKGDDPVDPQVLPPEGRWPAAKGSGKGGGKIRWISLYRDVIIHRPAPKQVVAYRTANDPEPAASKSGVIENGRQSV